MKNKSKFSYSSIVVSVISILILGVVISLSIFFLYYEKRLVEVRTLKLFDYIISNISDIAIESITREERSFLHEYIKNIKNNPELGIIDANIYQFREDKTFIYVSLDTRNFGKNVPIKKSKFLKSIENTLLLKEKDSYKLYKSLKWRVKNKIYNIGCIELIFSPQEAFKFYFHYRNFLIGVVLLSILFISVLIILYIRVARKLEEKMREVELLSITDELTKIFNRKKINEELSSEINRAKRYGDKFSLIMFDIDHFKKINDTYGHNVGDDILTQITRVVGSNLRITDIFGRWGGEEFLIICPDTGIKEAEKLAERIRKRVEEFAFPVVKNVTCSLGVTMFKKDDNVESLLKRVDDALYMAKERGRNKVVSINHSPR